MWNTALLWLACGTLPSWDAPLAREPVWLRAAQGRVELLTTADARTAQWALAELEALRGAVAQTAPWLAAASAPLRIVAFSSEEEYSHYRINPHSPGYFAGGSEWSVIVLARLDPGSAASLRHEYIHYLLRSSGRKLPLWLEEGLADALSPLPRREADRRVRLLRSGPLMNWGELFAAKPAAALYQDWQQARLFYAQSWLLTEALIYSAEGRLDPERLDEWAAMGPSEEQAAQALIRRFLKRPRPVGRNWKLAPGNLSYEVAPAPAGLVWTVLGRVSMQLGRLDAAEEHLRKAGLVAPESFSLLGDLEYRRGRLEEARRAWRMAMARDAADVRTLLRLAVLEQDLPGGEMTPVLEKILAMDPTQEEARLALASQYIRRGRWLDARQRLNEVRSAPPRWANFYQQALALVHTRTGGADLLGTN
ncbi:MAG: tetratricopeptide repeat protein [Acidobacteriota bacterium]